MAARWSKLVLFGDSLTQNSFCDGGWVTQLADAFKRRCDVLNRGFSGYTAAVNKLILPNLLQNDLSQSDSIACVVILLGSNDAILPGTSDRAATVEQYGIDLADIVGQFISFGVQPSQIVLVTPPPVAEKMYTEDKIRKGMPGGLDVSYERVCMFAKECSSVGSKLGVDIIDINTEMQKDKDWTRYFEDGLHFSREGNTFVARQLLPVLESKLQHIPVIFPDWKDIDFKDLKQCFKQYLVSDKP